MKKVFIVLVFAVWKFTEDLALVMVAFFALSEVLSYIFPSALWSLRWLSLFFSFVLPVLLSDWLDMSSPFGNFSDPWAPINTPFHGAIFVLLY